MFSKLRIANKYLAIEVFEGSDLPEGVFFARLLDPPDEDDDGLSWGAGTVLTVRREFPNSQFFIPAAIPGTAIDEGME